MWRWKKRGEHCVLCDGQGMTSKTRDWLELFRWGLFQSAMRYYARYNEITSRNKVLVDVLLNRGNWNVDIGINWTNFLPLDDPRGKLQSLKLLYIPRVTKNNGPSGIFHRVFATTWKIEIAVRCWDKEISLFPTNPRKLIVLGVTGEK